MRFVNDGNRSEFENIYFDRRDRLFALTIAECATKKYEYLPDIINLIWAILEETTWIIPAHFCKRETAEFESIPSCYSCGHWFVDLFSAETGSILSMIYYYLKDELKQFGAGALCDRIEYEIKRRITDVFLSTNDMWWMGFDGNPTNNWTTWIISNILVCMAVIVEEDEKRAQIIEKCCMCLDNYFVSFLDDGGCPEGSMYWTHAGACVFDCLEILYDLTGETDFFKSEKLKNIVEFISKIHIDNNYYISYADTHPMVYIDGTLCRRIGKRFSSNVMQGFGSVIQKEDSGFNTRKTCHCYRMLKNLLSEREEDTIYVPEKSVFLPDLQLGSIREKSKSGDGFFVWMKGRNIGISHIHADVGSVGVYFDGRPILIDIGVGIYTKETFGSKRFELFAFSSSYHNLPIIDGIGQVSNVENCNCTFEFQDGVISSEFSDCYENKDIINKLNRSVSIKRACVCIEDVIKLKNKKTVIVNFFCVNKPDLLHNGAIRISDNIVMEFNRKNKVEFTEIVFNDSCFEEQWKSKSVFRISIKIENEADIFERYIIKRQETEKSDDSIR